MAAIKPKSLPLSERLTGIGACDGSCRWANSQSPRKAWENCERGDWLLWIAEEVGVDSKLLTLAACDCVELALPLVVVGEDRPANALHMIRRRVEGGATIEEVDTAEIGALGAAEQSETATVEVARAISFVRGPHFWNSATLAASAAKRAGEAVAWKDAKLQAAAVIRRRIPWKTVKAAIKKAGV